MMAPKGPPAKGYQGARSSHPLLLMLSCIKSREGKQHQAIGKSRPQQSTILIAYLHNQSYYIDPNPSSVCFQRQHQGELCPSSHACSNSMYNTNNIVLETEGTTGTGLLAGRDIFPNEIIAVFSNAIILQDRGLVQEFTKLINTYNMDHPTQGFQYSIFYPLAGDSYPSVVIPDLDKKLAHGLPNLSKQLCSRLRHGSSTAGLAHLANHTCCPHHRNSELQILSVFCGRRIRRARSCKAPLEIIFDLLFGFPINNIISQGPAVDGPVARNSTSRATKLIRKGTPVLTCYRNMSAAGTTPQLIKERETLSRMFQCSYYLCGGSCGASGSVVSIGHAAPSSLLVSAMPLPPPF